ncbi:MAG: efflux RND transporter periplasmic adaptor subunit [Candidatus Aminicenantes bacterium]|nr:efflux RND transporter periplasmic adaptor subunit [Candidatus Aminicenantes bacterium]
MRKPNIFLSGLALVLLAAACGTPPEALPEAVSVEVQKARPADEAQDLAYSGTMEASTSIPLSFASVGTVVRVLVAEGDAVRKGQLLAELDPASFQNAYDMALAARAQAEDAYRRVTPMHKNGTLTDVKYVEVETGVQQAQAAAGMAKKALDNCRLYATTDGFVGSRSLDPGMVSLPNIASITIVKISKVFARVAVPENEIARIKKGAPAQIHIGALRAREYAGTIEEIGVMADVLAHTYKIKIGIANPEGVIKPGMVCNAVLRFPGEARGLVIPNQALLVDETGRHFVYGVDAAKQEAFIRYVQIGKLMKDGIEITAGLTADDLVVTAGHQKLADRSSVKIVHS